MTPAARADTPALLRAATVEVLRWEGVASVSARRIAQRAGVNQALIFYHFGSLSQLIDDSCRESVEVAIARYQERLAEVETLIDLLDLGRVLQETETKNGNMSLMAQLLAGARNDAALAETAAYCLDRWMTTLQAVVDTTMVDSAFSGVIDSQGLTATIVAGFIGIQLLQTPAQQSALETVDRLGRLVSRLEQVPASVQRVIVRGLRVEPTAGVRTTRAQRKSRG